jgi:hypothetical protein
MGEFFRLARGGALAASAFIGDGYYRHTEDNRSKIS